MLTGNKPWLVFEADKFHMKDGKYEWKPEFVKASHERCFSTFKLALKDEIGPLVVANTSTTEKEFKRYMDAAIEHGYQVFSIVVEHRHAGQNIHNVPEETLRKMEERFEIKLRNK